MASLFKPIIILFEKFWCGLVFIIFKALASTLDALTQLFFVFAGMTPVSNGFNTSTGEIEQVDIVNFFLQDSKFQSVYFKLCLIALGLIVVFTIGRIIKQDYFDRSGPRSKGPIFRNVALSFIAFICIIPVFYFLISACGALALAVMKAMGYEGGGLGTMLFKMSWSEGGGEYFAAIGEKIADGAKQEDINNFNWYPTDTFFHHMYNENSAKKWAEIGTTSSYLDNGIERPEFYWYIFLFGSLILIIQLGKMILAMLSRIYKLISLFLIAPSPISQIVLDDGQKFKQWKDKVVQEGLKVVGCVMSFMIFVMIITAVDGLELTTFINEPESASAISLIESNGLIEELSNVNLLYYGGKTPNAFDSLINALGKMCLIVAGGGAIADIDSTISPLLSGASSSLDMGNAGKSVMAAGKAGMGVAKDVLMKTGHLAGAAAGGVANAIGKAGLAKAAAKESLANKLGGEGKATTPSSKPPATPTPGGSGGGNGKPGLGAATSANGGTSSEGATGKNSDAASDATKESVSQSAGAATEGINKENNDAAGDATKESEAPNTGAATESGVQGVDGENNDAANDATKETETPNAGVATESGVQGSDGENNDAAKESATTEPSLNKKQQEKFANKEGSREFWKSIGKSAGKTALKSPLNVLKLAGGLASSAVGATLRATGYGAVVDDVKQTVFGKDGKGGIVNAAKGGFAKHAGPALADYSKMKAKNKADAKQQKALEGMDSRAEKFIEKNDLNAAKKTADTPQAKELQTAFDKYETRSSNINANGSAMNDAINSLNTERGHYNAENVASASPKILATSKNIGKSADSINDYAVETGQEVDKELLYSGDEKLEQKFSIAQEKKNDADKKYDSAKKDYDNAVAKRDKINKSGKEDGKWKKSKLYKHELNKANEEVERLEKTLKVADSVKRGTTKNLNDISKDREKAAKKANTLRYQQVKATENFEDAIKHSPRGGVRGRKEVTALKNSLADTSKKLNQRIAETNEKLYVGETDQINEKYDKENVVVNQDERQSPKTNESTQSQTTASPEIDVVVNKSKPQTSTSQRVESKNAVPPTKENEPASKKVEPKVNIVEETTENVSESPKEVLVDKGTFKRNIENKQKDLYEKMQSDEIDPKLQRACVTAMKHKEITSYSKSESKEKGAATRNFLNECKKMDTTCIANMSDEYLRQAMDSIDLNKINDDILKKNNLNSRDDYRRDVENRYNNAVNSYSASISKAKEAAAQHKSGNKNNPELIQEIRKALEQAYKDNLTINSIKVELHKVSEDK